MSRMGTEVVSSDSHPHWYLEASCILKRANIIIIIIIILILILILIFIHHHHHHHHHHPHPHPHPPPPPPPPPMFGVSYLTGFFLVRLGTFQGPVQLVWHCRGSLAMIKCILVWTTDWWSGAFPFWFLSPFDSRKTNCFNCFAWFCVDPVRTVARKGPNGIEFSKWRTPKTSSGAFQVLYTFVVWSGCCQ